MGSTWSINDAPSQAGKLAIVTGANSGIGFPTALALGQKGAHVIIACRDAGRGGDAVDRLRAADPRGTYELKQLDLSDLTSVQRFADELLAAGRPVDLLVNNAGIMNLPKRELSPQGFEMQIATNHLGHFALTGRLLPLLQRSAAPRVVNVASLMAHTGNFNGGIDLRYTDETYNPRRAYGNSKLANLLFSEELSRRHPRLTVTSSHPGGTATNLMQHESKITQSVSFLLQSAANGARPSVYAAIGAGVKSGDYFGPMFGMWGDAVFAWKPSQAKNTTFARELWTASEKATGVVY